MLEVRQPLLFRPVFLRLLLGSQPSVLGGQPALFSGSGPLLGGGSLCEVMDPERLDQKALEVVKSVEQELADWAVSAYEDLAGGR
ncbi:hypothetical protein KBZ00_16815 [Streptomyces sp. RK31]|uniref:hypothetical protein n=1 Tax=Streptomyces sp. RK31 TaxID=2824892 RepID=UPI001B376A1F|nr:hypothetical protein [Streptomyces sp. RK31]MBQ0972791.1 hypothetical protein [Streptomyces sp. RK31]